MRVAWYFYRFGRYYKKHGFWNTISQAAKKIPLTLFPSANHLLFVELTDLPEREKVISSEYQVVRRENPEAITNEERDGLIEHLGRIIYDQQIKERFHERKSMLWLAKREENVVGFLWTLAQHTVKPFYWPLTPKDIHFYHQLVLPEYRGRGIAGVLCTEALYALKEMGYNRAFAEVLKTNTSSIRYLRKTLFIQYGIGRRFSVGPFQIGVFHKNWKKEVEKIR